MISAKSPLRWPLLFFFLSGFSGLVYQIVWLRLAFAQFGVITPVLSVVVSVFMLGLGLGALLSGRWIETSRKRDARFWLKVYAGVEFTVGAWAAATPFLLRGGARLLEWMGPADSAAYLASSAACITLALFPACFLMGMTIPLMMAYLRHRLPSTTHFSFLYAANVGGALTGAVLAPFVLIEFLGFQSTNYVGVLAQWGVGWLAYRQTLLPPVASAPTPAAAVSTVRVPLSPLGILGALALTGFVSMGFEITWTRLLTPVLGTTVYAFASVLAVYLAATALGAVVYRRDLAAGRERSLPLIYTVLTVSAFLPVIMNDPRWKAGWLGALESLVPFCAVLGYLTPLLVDAYSQGRTGKAGLAYAANIVGCVLGPLAAGYLVLPVFGAQDALITLTLPLAGLFLAPAPALRSWAWSLSVVVILIGFYSSSRSFSYDDKGRDTPPREIRRDHVATVLSYGQGSDRRLLVNGIGITYLTPVAKMMSHHALFVHGGTPRDALVICFGMGTSFRSLMSWDLNTTAVELVPSVVKAFGFYFNDAAEVLSRPNARVVIDDGRRYLRRTSEVFDVITLDPPPPVEASGSGLLYSKEFYEDAIQCLKPDGVLQQWLPGAMPEDVAAVARTFAEAFPYVRVYQGQGGWGHHFLGSRVPLRRLSVQQILIQMPPAVRQDFLEWSPAGQRLEPLVKPLLELEVPIESLYENYPGLRITDDRPFNEFYVWRRFSRY